MFDYISDDNIHIHPQIRGCICDVRYQSQQFQNSYQLLFYLCTNQNYTFFHHIVFPGWSRPSQTKTMITKTYIYINTAVTIHLGLCSIMH